MRICVHIHLCVSFVSFRSSMYFLRASRFISGYQGGSVTTAPVRVIGDSVKVSVDGGSSTGIQVGIFGSSDLTVENCDPIKVASRLDNLISERV